MYGRSREGKWNVRRREENEGEEMFFSTSFFSVVFFSQQKELECMYTVGKKEVRWVNLNSQILHIKDVRRWDIR